MSPELDAAFNGLVLAALTAATGGVVALGIAAVGHIRASSALRVKQQELAQLELDEKIRARQKAAALDAAAIAQETSYGRTEPLSGPAKAQLAADKLRELAPDLAGADRSQVADLVKVGVAQLKSQQSLPAAYLVQSEPPPPLDVVRAKPANEDGPPTLPPPRKQLPALLQKKEPPK